MFDECKHETVMTLLRVGSQYSLPIEVIGLVYNVADLIQLPSVDQPNFGRD